ncbi:signal-induced proliferation-associated 1-like protein 1 isoform X1 [Brienomyrus brachyistius]|uniref:signal-induced proliferation-associated 1-like protein 1 isoform X1 n=1 Tax=Brienomyrus brachyistius TaxID=42636 RepID=UPI0020B35E7F|nr:signal-induced proliferation-associated 1-like protein 1 isoform X1 [Brienomyrus brachyistius]XP_048852812.1 signal-induced proliferation-associated 1-like protein 1 isoform X1 [Brienomyrus brachyistius]XP_048852813.1 signal-induced proliferation-associated 1-like protein 1 isoform X1 [Brienomyrus brachyistius]XP_048856453.1 signal-induced proliferation-associated 1-like protein 1 isoform X1 [Brienomyrus brachyistius]XP_048856454.1 signal-induced proliferation-associated 1-like protein 1 iso
MTSLKRSQTERSVGGSVPATDEFYTRRLRLPNGGAPPPRSESAHLSGCTPGVPKMGVRARVADWPPRKDGGGVWHITVETDSPSTVGGTPSNLSSKLGHLVSPQDSSMLRNIQNTLKSKMQSASRGKDNRFLSPDGYLGSPRKGMRRIRQRSNSDITISELDGDGAEGWSFSGWTPMHREYGSTSSIDKHGSGESFFDMLKGYHSDLPDQRSSVSEKLGELFSVAPKLAGLDLPEGPIGVQRGSPSSRLKEREKPLKKRSKSETGGESIFRKLRSAKGDGCDSRAGSDAEDGRSEDGGPPAKPWVCQKGFAHFDIQSLFFDLNSATQSGQAAIKRKNMTTGASAAAAASASTTSSASSVQSGASSSPCGSQEELSLKDSPTLDPGDDKSNELLLSCPCFRNEIGGELERDISPSKAGSIGSGGSASGEDSPFESSLSSRCPNAALAILEAPKDSQGMFNEWGKRYFLEHVDLGSCYYRKYFYLREHWNYFGIDETLGPVAVSLRREKLEDHKDHGPQYNYRIIFRTSELTTLRGSILEDAVPSSSKHGMPRGLPLKEVLEYLVPEMNTHCLRLALNTPKVTEQLMKLDEQGLNFQLKVGVMYCLAGQGSEEEMYNNEAAGPALEEFLQLLGERVRLKGFTKYRAQLDTKTDSTGTHSLFTTYKDYEIMFHVSTMLPYTPNNKQQLLRKRHIGNDIVTIVFQEPGAQPFTPKNIRSHFQHVFVIVRVHNPCSESTCYSVAVTRSKDVPPFGPLIPKGVTFPKSSVFRDFLLSKVINAENAAHKSEKFRAMATRTRQEYLRDLAEHHVTSTPIDSSGKFPFISLAHKRKEKSRPYNGAELRSLGAVTWSVLAEDHSTGGQLDCLLAISNEFLVLLDTDAKLLVFNCLVQDVIGWTQVNATSMKIFYERGECISLRSINNNTEDFREVILRLELLTKGCGTMELTLRRNGLGQLGFHVNYEGIVAEVEPYGYAWQAGLRQGSRLVEICKVGVASLSHEQMIDLLRTSVTVKVVVIPPHEDTTPRRGCTEMAHTAGEHKATEGVPYECKFPFRSNNNKWQRTSNSPQQSLTASPQSHGGTPSRTVSLGGSMGKALSAERPERVAAIPRSVSSDGRPLDPKRISPSSDSYGLSPAMIAGRSSHNRLSPSSLSFSSDASSGSSAHWRQKSMPEGFVNNRPSSLCLDTQSTGETGGGGRTSGNRLRVEEGGAAPAAERGSADLPVSKSGQPYSGAPRIQRQEQVIHISPKKISQSEASYSGHSSSTTMSSNTSSSTHSEDKWYEAGSMGEQSDPDHSGYGGDGLQDGGTDGTSCGAIHGASSSILVTGSVPPKERPSSAWQPSSSEGSRRQLERSLQVAESSIPPGAIEPASRAPSSLISMASQSSSRRCGSPLVLKSSRSTREDSSLAASSSQNSAMQGPKSFYPRQGATSKYLIGWKKPGGTINSVDFGDTRKRPQNDGQDGGLPQSRSSPREIVIATTEEKAIPLDISPPRHKHSKTSSSPHASPARHSLHRTLSDESIYRGTCRSALGSPLLEPESPSDVLFSCSTMPRSPTTRGPPLRRPSYKMGVKLHGDFSASDTSLADLHDRRSPQHLGPTLMPLPATHSSGGLGWTSLVDCADVFDIRSSAFFPSQESNIRVETPSSSPKHGERQLDLQSSSSASCDASAGLAGKVTQLESLVKRLQEHLKKEREEKMMLQTQIQSLRQENQRLLQESQTASAKLKKFTEWVFNTIDMS